eukprot:56682-Prorocentrum_lima.AAC.1
MRDSLPILVTRCSDGWVSSHVAPRKGTENYALAVLTNEIVTTSSGDVLVLSDQEPSILSLREES